MRCPSCNAEDTRVIDSRVIEDGGAIRRRRLCERCSFRFTTLEEIEILTLQVVKQNGREETYDKEKMVHGIKLALRKRPVSPANLKKAVHLIEREIQTTAKKDKIRSEEIGTIVMKHLKKLDKVAYIRFASVYRSFEDLEEFADELQKLSPKKRPHKKK